MKKKESILKKITNFFKRLFKSKKTKALSEPVKKQFVPDVDMEAYKAEKARIFSLYEDVKKGKVRLMSLSTEDLQKIAVLSEAEANLSDRQYKNKLKELRNAI